MSFRLCISFGIIFGMPAMVSAQRAFRETVEPPLADPSGATARDPIMLTSATRMVDGPMPVVQLAVRAPAMQAAGTPVTIKLIIENVARSPAQNVVVIYPLPAGVTVTSAVPPTTAQAADSVTWKFDTLAAASRKEIALTLTAAAGASELTHKARIAYEFEPAVQTTRFAKPELKLRKVGPEQALKHDILVMALEVSNSGSAETADVQLVDALPEGFEHRADDPAPTTAAPVAKPASEISADKRTRTFKLGKIAPGQSRRVDYYVVAANVVGPNTLAATATAAGMTEPVRAESKITVAEPKLEISVEAPPRRPANQPTRVVIKLTNKSLRALANIVVTDRLAGGGHFDSASLGGQTMDGRAQWIVPLLAANETRSFEAVLRCPQGGRVSQQVSAVYRGLSQAAEATTEFEAIAALQWDFRSSTHALELNSAVQYTLSIRNVGTAPAVNVRPAVTLPPELKLVKATPTAADNSGRIAFDAVTVPAGGRLECTVSATAIHSAVEARVIGEVAADLFAAGPVRKQETLTIGSNEIAASTRPPAAQPRLPQPAEPPKQ